MFSFDVSQQIVFSILKFKFDELRFAPTLSKRIYEKA